MPLRCPLDAPSMPLAYGSNSDDSDETTKRKVKTHAPTKSPGSGLVISVNINFLSLKMFTAEIVQTYHPDQIFRKE